MIETRRRFIDCILTEHPTLSRPQIESLVADQLVSPFTVELPVIIHQQAQELVSCFFHLRQKESYKSFYKEQTDKFKLEEPGNYGIAMSYDVHWDPKSKKLRLIEINTNAAFLFLSQFLYQSREIAFPISDFSFSELKEIVEKERRLAVQERGGNPEISSISIIDAEPELQKLYVEFLVAQKFFEKKGIACSIQDFKDYKPGSASLVYNRFTDFYFRNPNAEHLQKSFENHTDVFSPNPTEYFYLADKQRMIDWHSTEFKSRFQDFSDYQKFFSDYLPQANSFSELTKELIWSERKNYFFKPKNSYGSKSTYKGASVSRKVFEAMNSNDFLRQEYIVAPEKIFSTPEGEIRLKYDLRLYAYQDRLQMIVARLYQGQVTNLRTKYGGFAAIKWENI